MGEEDRPAPRVPAPILSLDKRFYWDGEEWQPVERSSEPRPLARQPLGKGRTAALVVLGLIVIGAGIGLSRLAQDSPTSARASPTPAASSSAPHFASDPKVQVTPNEAQRSFTISATNTSDIVCHDLALHVLGESGVDPQPQAELNYGVSEGKVYPFKDVAPGQTVSTTLDAKAIMQVLPAGQSFVVGAKGQCLDSGKR